MGKFGKPGQHFSPSAQTCRSRRVAFESRDDRASSGAVRALDDHHVAGTQSAAINGFERKPRPSRPGAACIRPAARQRDGASSGRRRREDRRDWLPMRRRVRRAARRRSDQVPACRRGPRCGGRYRSLGSAPSTASAARMDAGIGVVAFVDQRKVAVRRSGRAADFRRAPRCGGEARKAAAAASRSSPNELRGKQHRERVHRQMAARRAEAIASGRCRRHPPRPRE